jgi:hypothetical protein
LLKKDRQEKIAKKRSLKKDRQEKIAKKRSWLTTKTAESPMFW